MPPIACARSLLRARHDRPRGRAAEEDRILAAIKPDQGNDGFVHIFNALTQAISFQMALLCPDCRRRLARKLKSHIPMMMTNAAQLAKEAQKEHGVQHLH